MMATRVCVGCPDCGPLKLAPEDVRLFTHPSGYRSRYAFTCPTCQAWVSRPAPPRLVQALRAVCVPEQRMVPAEVLETRRGRPLTVDEVLDFALAAVAVDDLARLAARPA